MKNVLSYKDFIGSINFSASDSLFFGKIEGVNDLVTFEGQSVDELVKAFHEAVDDYIVLCENVGKEPRKSYKGSFNVRTTPEIHRKAAELATINGISLNQLVHHALKKEVETKHRV